MKKLTLLIVFFTTLFSYSQNGNAYRENPNITEIKRNLVKLDRELNSLEIHKENNNKYILNSKGRKRRNYRKDSIQLRLRIANNKHKRDSLTRIKDSLIIAYDKKEIEKVKSKTKAPLLELRKTQVKILKGFSDKAYIYCDSIDFNAKSIYNYEITDSLLSAVNKRHLRYKSIIDDCIDNYNGFSRQFNLDKDFLRQEKMTLFLDPKEFECVYE